MKLPIFRAYFFDQIRQYREKLVEIILFLWAYSCIFFKIFKKYKYNTR